MSSRESILNKVKANRPALVPLPEGVVFASPPEADRVLLFIKSFESAGGVAVQVPDAAGISIYLKEHLGPPGSVLNTVQEVKFGQYEAADLGKGHVLENLTTAVITGRLGVAENGAIWVSESDLPIRVLPFICEHLVLVIPASSVIGTMHEAYSRLQVSEDGYGVFIAGPSRTADIEQSLVIGAHGPKRAHVFIIENL